MNQVFQRGWMWSAGCALAFVGAGLGVRAEEETVPLLAELEARFTPAEAPVAMEYEVGYRFLNIELADVGCVVVTTTVGEWRHQVSGEQVPSILVDVRVDSPDSGRPGERRRVSLHDRILTVLTAPELEALFFARYADQYLNPLLGRAKEVRQLSLYDLQSGQVSFMQSNLVSGLVTTNLAHPERLLELSREIGPLMRQLVERCDAEAGAATNHEPARISVNMDGKVVPILLKTAAERSPRCLGRERLDALRISSAAEKGSGVKPRDFHAWSMSFHELALSRDEPGLAEAARVAPVASVVPLVFDYELAVGRVRATMTSVRAASPTTNALPVTVTPPPALPGAKPVSRRPA